MGKYQSLAKNTVIISAGTLLSKLIVFFMVRFYTGHLSPADYGTADLITTTVSLLTPLISLGITDGVFRFAPDYPGAQKSVFSTGVYTITAGAGLFLLLLPALHLVNEFRGYLQLLVLLTMASCYHALCAQFVRAEGKTILYATQGLLNTALVVTLNVLFLTVCRLGITGYVLSVAVADLICTIFLIFKEKLWQYLTPHPEKVLWHNMLRYSIPLIPTAIFWWITSVSDRYMINALIGSEANGIYTVANKLPTILTLASGVILEAWQFSAISEATDDRTEQLYFYSNIWQVFFSVLFLAGSFIVAFSKVEIRLLAASDYYEAWQYVPILCAATLFCAFTSFMGSVYTVKKRSGLSFLASMIGAVLNILLNVLFIPSQLGVFGAAIATFLSYFVVFLLRAKNARRLIPFRLYKGKLTINTLILSLQLLFITLKWTGWMAVQAIAILLLVLVNGKQMLKCLHVLKHSAQS